MEKLKKYFYKQENRYSKNLVQMYYILERKTNKLTLTSDQKNVDLNRVIKELLRKEILVKESFIRIGTIYQTTYNIVKTKLIDLINETDRLLNRNERFIKFIDNKIKLDDKEYHVFKTIEKRVLKGK